MKILAVVKFNQGEALVLDKIPEMIHTKMDDKTIIGEAGMFLQFYGYETPSKGWEAFAGRKFDLPMSNGEVTHCHGQWWDGMTKSARQLFPDAIRVTANTIDELQKCYVYFGYSATKKDHETLRATYTGKVYEYREYEDLIKNQIPILP